MATAKLYKVPDSNFTVLPSDSELELEADEASDDEAADSEAALLDASAADWLAAAYSAGQVQ